MNDGKLVAIVTTRTFVYVEVPPLPRQIFSVSFFRKGSIMTGLVTLVAVPDNGITSSPARVDFASGAPSVTIDCVNPSTSTFAVPDGETSGTVTPLGDINDIGPGPAGPAFSFTVSTTPPTHTTPVARTVESVTFQ